MTRTLPVRLLHPLRRRWTITRLRSRRPPDTVLIVCHGNICRSPYAAAMLRRLLPDALAVGMRVDSAGFVAPHRWPPPEAMETARAHGVDLGRHVSRVMARQDVLAAELILVMEPAQQTAVCARFGRRREDVFVLGDLDPEPITTRTIRDPVEQPPSVFEESYARIDRCLRVFINAFWPGAVPEPRPD
jgi:protein-tyrosine phosphatase